MIEEILCCPVCGQPLTRQEKALVCQNRHSFDIARQGHVNLLPVTQKHSKHPGDTRDMVAARRAFLDRGYYLPIAEQVGQMLGEKLPEHPKVLDAGCGEGYYLSQLMERFGQGAFYGVDISKDAVRYAAGRNKRAMWITASAAHLPVTEGCMDGVMSMFALTVPEEFHRVEKTLEFDFQLSEHEEIMQLLTMTPHLWRISREGSQRAAEATQLKDRAQVLFRLYQSVATSSGL